jgi:Lon protease-like protein
MIKDKNISFFPLNISLLPGEDIPLKVFEPKYKQLINECLKDKKSFGIPFTKGSETLLFGSEVKIKQMVAKNSKGEMVITVEAIANFEITSFKDPAPGKLYSTGHIIYLDTNQIIKHPDLLRMLIYYTDNLDPQFLSGVKGNDILQTDLAKALNLSSEDKNRFISLKDASTKDLFLFAQMNYLLKLREQEDLLNNDYYLN